ncbi:alpha- and gamma-adaptin-binding protein p34 [Diachasma alloeum]|uniref:alpha- and gamma-adaptin-binding protein p34 n=1 Tax=Diachasma alloeum TaxID=454923 RepID=UPI000738143C|nr:alpha- and gamma-adaptin-binding protein p34 [Diachasma alloeum]
MSSSTPMDLPRVLIVSSQVDKASNLAKDMGANLLAEEGKVKYFSWVIDNKYYTAQALLCTTHQLPLEIPVEGIEAVILCYDPKETEGSLGSYVALVEGLTDADVMLLACDSFPDANKRDEATEWCHINKFELVDMELPADSSESMEEGVEQENYGIERIIEALHTHCWPNRELKGLNNGRISTSNEPDVSDVESQLENIRLHPNRDPANHLLMESVLDGIMGEENADFGELFGQLMAMKEHAASLSTSNRKAAAEQLVTAFWRAMGGDPAEIEDLDQ